tara:strand:+ start:2195 stop:3187 length:993 start_codon:yes stop_codon:yes gene_type:complete
MLIKSFEKEKIDLDKQKMHLLYGENQGQIEDLIDQKFKKSFGESIFKYEEIEILNNENIIFDIIKTKSFFEDKKLIIINRATDKIIKIIEKISDENLDDVNVALTSNILEKKSKLRSFFEKSKKHACIPFYKDNDQSLINLITAFCNEKKLNLSRQNINLIIHRANSNRQSVKNELKKIDTYCLNKKMISEEEILKITNVIENHDIPLLIDNCLVKNKKKIVQIMNDNNFTIDETIQIIRIFLAKAKRLKTLAKEVERTKNINQAIISHKPPIFWKDKEVIKKQLEIWTKNNLNKLIRKINIIELQIKKNSVNSIYILLDFIFSETTARN